MSTTLLSGGRAPAIRARGRGLVAILLRVPLFWKLLLAGVGVTGGTAAVVLWTFGSGSLQPGTTSLLAVLAGVTLGTAVVQAVVLSVALSPLRELERVAEQIRDGSPDLRARPSLLSDARFDRLRVTFNQMVECLAASERRQRSAARNALGDEESQRDQIARQLYAGPAQSLAGLLIHLRVLAVRHPVAAADVAQLDSEARGALHQVRRLARQLRPPELDELGLQAALEAQARSLREMEERDISVRGHVAERLDASVSLTLFRFAQWVMTDARGSVHLMFTAGIRGRVVLDVIRQTEDSGPSLAVLDDWVERVRWAGGHLAHEPLPDGSERLRVLMPTRDAALPSSPSPSHEVPT